MEPEARAEVVEPTLPEDAEPLLPTVPAKDDPRAWGDKADEGYDDWLKEQRPPHWG